MNTNNKLNVVRALVAGAALLFGVCANADMIKSFVNINFQDLSNELLVETPLQLTAAGVTSVNFNAAVSGKYFIMYSANCSVGVGAIAISILVDGTAIAPANTWDSFCEGPDYGYHTIVAPTRSLSVGTHTVEIHARAAGIGVQLSSSSLIIVK